MIVASLLPLFHQHLVGVVRTPAVVKPFGQQLVTQKVNLVFMHF